MRWFAVHSAALAMAAWWCTQAPYAQAQPVPQAPASNAVPITTANFNRAETDLNFGRLVTTAASATSPTAASLHLDDSPIVRPDRDTLYSFAVLDFDAGPVTITLPDAGKRFTSMQVIDEDQIVNPK